MRPNSPSATTIVVRQQTAVAQVLEQRRVRLSKFGATSFDICSMSVNGLRAVDVPGHLVEDRLEHVHGHEPHAGLDEPPGHQAALAEARPAVAIAFVLPVSFSRANASRAFADDISL